MSHVQERCANEMPLVSFWNKTKNVAFTKCVVHVYILFKIINSIPCLLSDLVQVIWQFNKAKVKKMS